MPMVIVGSGSFILSIELHYPDATRARVSACSQERVETRPPPDHTTAAHATLLAAIHSPHTRSTHIPSLHLSYYRHAAKTGEARVCHEPAHSRVCIVALLRSPTLLNNVMQKILWHSEWSKTSSSAVEAVFRHQGCTQAGEHRWTT